MDLNPYLASLRQALGHAAGTSTPEVQEATERIAQSLEPALRLTLMELASDVAAEVTSRLDGAVVEVRLRGGLAELVVDQQAPTEQLAAPTPPEPPAPTLPPEPEDASHTRVTLRLPESVKARVDDAAAADGVSINSWLVRAVQKSLATPGSTAAGTSPTRSGRRMSGWVR